MPLKAKINACEYCFCLIKIKCDEKIAYTKERPMYIMTTTTI
jgi:hypothetical protein